MEAMILLSYLLKPICIAPLGGVLSKNQKPADCGIIVCVLLTAGRSGSAVVDKGV